MTSNKTNKHLNLIPVYMFLTAGVLSAIDGVANGFSGFLVYLAYTSSFAFGIGTGIVVMARLYERNNY